MNVVTQQNVGLFGTILEVTGGGSVGQCGSLSQPNWLLGPHYNIVILAY